MLQQLLIGKILAAEICPVIDTVARRIEVVLPDGLREVNSRP